MNNTHGSWFVLIRVYEITLNLHILLLSVFPPRVLGSSAFLSIRRWERKEWEKVFSSCVSFVVSRSSQLLGSYFVNIHFFLKGSGGMLSNFGFSVASYSSVDFCSSCYI
jgi:hypothetical protein